MSAAVQILLLVFGLLLVLGVPISMALLLASAAAMLAATPVAYDLTQIPLQLADATGSFPLLAIPFFVLAGNIMSRGGMSERLIELARSMVGRVPGGIAMASVLASMFFAAVSGSTAATTAAIGLVLIPAMCRSGFSIGSAAGLQATAGSIGIIIPPSVPLVLLGVVGGLSIGKLFIGGIIPGILMGVALMLVAWLHALWRKHPPSSEAPSMKLFLRALGRAVLPLLTVVFVLGGILGGYVTPTEAAVVAVLWALVVSGPVYRRLSLSALGAALTDTVKVTAIVVLCIGATTPFAWLLTVENVPQDAAGFLLGLTDNPVLIKLLILLILLAIGTIIDLTPAMILLWPILMPVATGLGMDPIHFGVVVVLALAIGQSTPPVGVSLFVACSVARARIGQVALPILPFLLALIVVLLIVTFWPGSVLWLPDWLGS
jgi:C4-dicarboxylate transporter DctM subunit